MKVLSPIAVGPCQAPNRIVVPAMVTRLSGDDGYVNQPIIDRYRRYARGGVGLIVVEATAVHGAKSGPLLRLSDDRFIEGHRRLTDSIRNEGPSLAVVQIIHFLKVARSGWRQKIEDLSNGDIQIIIAQFADAAARAREAGYHGVELHAAHAYTLSSFLSRRNSRRDAYGGPSLEGRLRLFGEVAEAVRARVGHDFIVGVRFLAEEAIKDGYTIADACPIALRMAQCGVDYISLSVGGKFEDAVLRKGHPPYPYTGYSGDRCMPGAHYPPMPHVHLARAIKRHINSYGHDIPVIAAGKISRPEEAETLIEDGSADMIGMARQLLCDPDWVAKLQNGEAHRILHCIYCNVCKQLDENFRRVACYLWPKGAIQAPPVENDAPYWAEGGKAGLSATWEGGAVALQWRRAEKATGYQVFRGLSDEDPPQIIATVRGIKHKDTDVLGGSAYRYFIRPYGPGGIAGPVSETQILTPPLPAYLHAGNN